MIALNQNIETEQNCVTWILTALMMTLRNGLTHLIIMNKIKDPFPIGKNKKVIGFFKDELGGKIMKEFVALRAKTYSYLMDDHS